MNREEALKILTELEEYHRDDAPSSWSDNEAEALLSIVKRVVELHQPKGPDRVYAGECNFCDGCLWPCPTWKAVSMGLSKLMEEE